jgi:hypothetical protein
LRLRLRLTVRALVVMMRGTEVTEDRIVRVHAVASRAPHHHHAPVWRKWLCLASGGWGNPLIGIEPY